MAITIKAKVPDELGQRSPALNDIISRKPDSLIKWSMVIFVALILVISIGINRFKGRKYIKISAYITTIYNSKEGRNEIFREIGNTLHARAELNPIQRKEIRISQKVIFQVLANATNISIDAYVGALAMDSIKKISYADIIIPLGDIPSQLSFQLLKTGTGIDGVIIIRNHGKMTLKEN